MLMLRNRTSKRATEYIHDGNYYWNAGIFIWQVETVLKGMEQHMPNLYKGLLAIEEALREGKKTKADTIFKAFERKSIDYGLMEKARNVLMVPAIFQVGRRGHLGIAPKGP